MRELLRHPRSAAALVALLAIPLSASIASAQAALETPSLSSKARVEQRVGITDFSVDYSSPGVKKRKIWGELVAYDKPWRAGANAPTKLTASRDFSLGGTAVKAGSYSVFMIPGKAKWTVILNTDVNANEGSYDQKKDAARITVAPVALSAPRERLLYIFDDAQDDRASLDLEWERLRIRVPITVDTKGQVKAAIDKATGDAWRTHYMAASFLHENGDANGALAMIDKSIGIQSTWRNEWLRAQIMGKKGNKAEATAAAARAQNLGKGDQIYEQFFKANIEKALAGWK